MKFEPARIFHEWAATTVDIGVLSGTPRVQSPARHSNCQSQHLDDRPHRVAETYTSEAASRLMGYFLSTTTCTNSPGVIAVSP